MSEEIKDIFECLIKYADLTPDAIDDLYYLEEHIKDLQQRVEQLENIIKEAIEYIQNTDFDSDDNIVAKKVKPGIIGAFTLENKIPTDLLNILNKGSE